MSTTVTETPDLAAAIMPAWRLLYADPERHWRGDPGGRAALRRAVTPEAVMVVPAFHDILIAVRQSGVDLPARADANLYRWLAVAIGALAERRSGDGGGQRFAAALGGSSKPEERRFKTLRFQALIAALDRAPDADTLTALRRGMAIIADDRIDARQFVRDLLGWSDRTRIDWTFAYFGQPARPQTGTADIPATTHELEEQAK
jgi:CRISPR type I-E-associated protein CasB/Cse2